MTASTASNPTPQGQPLDDYDDVEEPIYSPGAPVQSRALRAPSRYADEEVEDEDSEGYQQYSRGYSDQDSEYDEDGEEVAVLSVNRGRALILGLSVVMMVAIFGVAIWLYLSQAKSAPSTAPIAGVPALTGFDPDTQAEDQKPVVGSFAPDFTWQENGQTVSLSSFRGSKPVFVNFWGTWCPPCRAEMPEMEAAYTKHYGQIEVIGVSMAPKDSASMVLNFVNQYKYNWKFVHDGDLTAANRYQVAAVPSSYFIGTDGKIKAVQVGAMLSGAIVENYMQQVIAR
ncbi:MAG TPA: TlpA disulfide reductase family protein [Chloroflexia bacterium]|nr:TlpA disulfide reductase family protein [Chloroflexia bacterium]